MLKLTEVKNTSNVTTENDCQSFGEKLFLLFLHVLCAVASILETFNPIFSLGRISEHTGPIVQFWAVLLHDTKFNVGI